MVRVLLLLALCCVTYIAGQAPFTIIEPSKDAQWLITKSYNITWVTNQPCAHVSVYLVRKGVQQLVEWFRINDNRANISLDLNVVSTISQTYNDWQILVEDASSSDKNSTSQYFTIIYPDIQVSTDSVWLVDDNKTISYSVSLNNTLVDFISINLLDSNDKVVYALSPNQANTGEFVWEGVQIGWMSSLPYHIQICWVAYPTVCGSSQSLLVSAPQFNISTPGSVYMGGILDIDWRAADVIRSASLWLLVPDAGHYMLCANTTSSCSLQPIPYWLYQSNYYSVLVCWDKYPTICTESSKVSVLAAINMQQSYFEPPLVLNGMYNITWATRVPVSIYSITLCKRYTPFYGGVELYEIYQGNLQNKFAGNFIWNSTLQSPFSPPEVGNVYFLKLAYVVQGATIYGISSMFSFIDRSNLSSLLVTSNEAVSTDDRPHITWQVVPIKSRNGTRNGTLPYVSIFLADPNIDDISGDRMIASDVLANSTTFVWTDVPTAVQSGNYKWRVCFSSGLLHNISCALSTSFKLSTPFKLTRHMVIYISAGVGGVLFIVFITIIVCCVRRRRRRLRNFTEHTPLVNAAHPSAPPASENAYLCKICMDQPLQIMLLPCNHYCLCEQCANEPGLGNLCPVCKAPIVDKRRVYVP